MPLLATAVVVASAALNRIRGDKSLLDLGKSLWYVAPLFGIVGMLAGLSIGQGAALAGIYLWWALPPWGRWFGLGRASLPDREASWYEWLIERITGPVHGRFLLRHCILIPALPVLAIWSVPWAATGLVLPLLFLMSYELAWRLYEARFVVEARGWLWLRAATLAPTLVAEALVGGLWGVYAVLGARVFS